MITKTINPIFRGLIVEYTYTHHLNSRSSTQITKRGTVIRAVRERNGLQRPTGFYMVQLNRNRTLSKIHESKLISLGSNDKKLLK